MVNEDILTALKNSVERGESLEEAKSILKSSGYNEKEIEEASSFVGRTPLQKLEPKPDEKLTMPGKKGFFSGILKKKEEPVAEETKKIPSLQAGEIEQIKQEISPDSQVQQITQQTNGTNPTKPSHLKEIILVVVLLILVGLLLTTVVFKNQFLKLFS